MYFIIVNVTRIKRFFNVSIWLVCGFVISLAILTHTPSVQSFIGKKVAEAVSDKLGTRVKIGRVDIGFLNRLIIDNVIIYDKEQVDMLKAGRISAKFDIIDLSRGHITITSAQLFALQARLYKSAPDKQPNFQFVLDSLASKDTETKSTLDLAIKSLVIRNGHVIYDEKYVARTQLFSPSHINIDKISTHIMLNKLSNDSLNIYTKKFSCVEQSGLAINDFTFSLVANRSHAALREFMLETPQSKIMIPELDLAYQCNDQGMIPSSLEYQGGLSGTITPSDFAPLAALLKDFSRPLSLRAALSGTSSSLKLKSIAIHQGNDVSLEGRGELQNWKKTPRWSAVISRFTMDAEAVKYFTDALAPKIQLPEFVGHIGQTTLHGKFCGQGSDITADANLSMAIGTVILKAKAINHLTSGRIDAKDLNIGFIANQDNLGELDGQLDFKALHANGKYELKSVNGNVTKFDYNGYRYQNIALKYNADGQYDHGEISIDDPNANVVAFGKKKKAKTPDFSIGAKIRGLNLARLNLTDQFKDATIDADIEADIHGSNFNNALGSVSVSNFNVKGGNRDYHLSQLTINAQRNDNVHELAMNSDFGNIKVTGRYNYATLLQSLTNIVGSKLPTLPGLPKMNHNIDNDFQINAQIVKSDWLNSLLGIPLNLKRPLTLEGSVRDSNRKIEMTLNLPSFDYGKSSYERGYIRLTSPDDVLEAFAHLQQVGKNDGGTYWNIHALAEDNKLHTLLSFENNGKSNFSGIINTEANFYNNHHGMATANINIQPSTIAIGDSVWHVKPASINYYENHLTVNHLSVEHNKQHIIINGEATPNANDTLTVDLHDVDVSYILNLINFHSVEFAGKATGLAHISSLFGKPDMRGDLWVRDFKFEDGRMGILTANVALNHQKEQLDIDATAFDENDSRTYIHGYVSPQRNYIDLNIKANNTRGEFIESFCSSFMRNTNLRINGNIRVFGDLSEVNLEGNAIADGSIDIKPLNTTYTLEACPVKLVPDEIRLANCNIMDRNGNRGVVNGAIYHKHLTRMTYDIGVTANNLLAYDFKTYGDQTFFGTVFATGDCRIKGKSGEVVIDAHATPQKGSFIEYNASSPESISNQSFIHWQDRDSLKLAANTSHNEVEQDTESEIDIASDIHLNLQIDCTPDATLRVLMDKQSGDYIALHGNGSIRATYFNKGDFDMFGTYEVESGVYKLTIQNIIRRDFQFLPGGTIGFGGDPMDAILKLKAQYAVNGVSLSDLNVGKSFTSNNIRVNCLMNITGTPIMPKVDFGLDLPTVSNDAKQMITQLINSEEGMNQQVLYLLAVGRFYSQNNNSNSSLTTQQQSRTSLAMQSILSGTISQQLNTILNTVTKNDNWNFGANISTGDEGWNNAEYEGLLSGRMLNNRLLFNGQFGYRDNANATTSFIGDFDLQYLIYPNGNLAVRVYNQTNDRYFTKNSLNTQGLGIILKRDFNGWRDLLGLHPQKKDKKAKKKAKKATSKRKNKQQ